MSAHNCRIGKIITNTELEFTESINTYSKNNEESNDSDYSETFD